MHSSQSGFLGKAALALALLLFTTHPLTAQVILTTTTSSEGMPHRYWEGGTSTWVDGAAAQYDGFFDGGAKHWAMPVFNFSLADLSGQSVTSATLNLYTLGTGGSVQIRAAGEGSANVYYNQATGGSLVADISNSPATWISVDITADNNNAVANGWSWIAYNVGISNGAGGSFAGVLSANAPNISANAITEPATFAVGAGLLVLGLAFWRRR